MILYNLARTHRLAKARGQVQLPAVEERKIVRHFRAPLAVLVHFPLEECFTALLYFGKPSRLLPDLSGACNLPNHLR